MTKTIKLAFLASVVLNLLLFGLILGRLPHGFDGRVSRQHRLEEALQKLPEPEQGRFRERFAQVRAAGDPLREQMDAVRNEALRLMSAATFDEAAYDRQVNTYAQLREEMFKRMSHVIRQTVTELSPGERRMFADLLRRPSPPAKQN